MKKFLLLFVIDLIFTQQNLGSVLKHNQEHDSAAMLATSLTVTCVTVDLDQLLVHMHNPATEFAKRSLPHTSSNLTLTSHNLNSVHAISLIFSHNILISFSLMSTINQINRSLSYGLFNLTNWMCVEDPFCKSSHKYFR